MRIIILYDSNDERVGCIYPRQAKQLVLKKQAIWLEKGVSLKMITATASSSALSEEEHNMETSSIYPSNAPIEPTRSVETIERTEPTEKYAEYAPEPEKILYEQAKRNIKARRTLLKNAGFVAVAWLVFAVFSVLLLDHSAVSHPQASRINMSLRQLERYDDIMRDRTTMFNGEMLTTFEVARQFGLLTDADISALQSAVSGTRTTLNMILNAHIPPFIYFGFGVMVALTAWLAVQVVEYAVGKRRFDPVAREYNRLRKRAVGIMPIALEE
ncbi:MAG: hypothetical protein FWG68_02995 [Defluviitaleaceae bacterium]|nr:hypothetical protein [Defluviitaleaceae bacterium]